MKKHSTFNKGFLLLETVVAVAIFSIAIVGFLKILDQTVDQSAQLQTQQQVMQELESELALASTQKIEEGKTILRVDQDITYEKECVVLRLMNQNKVSLNGLYQLTVRAKSKDQTFELQKYVYQP